MRIATSLVLAALVAGCSSSDSKSNDQYKREVVSNMHQSLLADLDALNAAAVDIQKAAPEPKGRGWSATDDAQAIEAMRAAWIRAREAYEHIEGALAPLFPDIDAAIDARYDDFLAELHDQGDSDLFDDKGVTGMHAIERILYSPSIPAHVVTLEQTLPGYKPAAFPATEAEAAEFKTKLCAKLIADSGELRDEWQPQNIDIAGAYQGLVALMNEQHEKVNKASTSEEESRYAQRTMADLRANLEGTTKVYAFFRPWITSKDGGAARDQAITDGLEKLRVLYTQYPGDAIPQPPEKWSSVQPTPADLATPFGRLFSEVGTAVDPDADGSVVHSMRDAAATLGFPKD